jgi:hypothetical protein
MVYYMRIWSCYNTEINSMAVTAAKIPAKQGTVPGVPMDTHVGTPRVKMRPNALPGDDDIIGDNDDSNKPAAN